MNATASGEPRRSTDGPRHGARDGRAAGVGSAAEPQGGDAGHAEQAAPTASAPDRPSSSIRTNPAIAVPRIAPIVFAAYSRLKAELNSAFRARYRVRVGRVAPIRTVAGARASNASAEPDEREQLRCTFQARIDARDRARDQLERDRRDQHDDHEGQLQEPVHPERLANAVRHPATDRAPDREAAEEAGQDRRHGLRRVAKDEDELTRPHDLVDQRRGTGQHEDGKDERQSIDAHDRASLTPGRASAAGGRPRPACSTP